MNYKNFKNIYPEILSKQMKISLFLIFNHRLTQRQKADSRSSLRVDNIVDLPEELEKLWRQIPPDLSKINNYLTPLKTWLNEHASKSDYVLLQGDFGATYIMVNFSFKAGLVPIYSTSKREAMEEHDNKGTVKLTHKFRHVIFRKYGV